MDSTPATRRLVARATRPAVRAGDPLLASPVTEVDAAAQSTGAVAAARTQAPMTPHATEPSRLAAPHASPPLSPPSTVGLAAAAPTAAGSIPPVESPEDPSGERWATGRRAAALTAWLDQPVLRPPAASPDRDATRAETATASVTVTETPSLPAVTTVSTADALAWLRSEPTDGGQDGGTLSNAMAVPATPIVVAEPRPPTGHPGGDSAPAAPARPAAASPPPRNPRDMRPPADRPVVIERIEIITPPARPPDPDPLASLAARRAGRSRHGDLR